MTLPLFVLMACGAPSASTDPPDPEPELEPSPMPIAPTTAEQHARNLRFRDNRAVFNDSAAWLDAHRDQALPIMERLVAEGGPAALGNARVLGAMDDPRTVPILVTALGADDDELAYEAAKSLAHTKGPLADTALRRAAVSEDDGVVRNALRAIELRGDASMCDVVRLHVQADDPIGAYAKRAMDALACP